MSGLPNSPSRPVACMSFAAPRTSGSEILTESLVVLAATVIAVVGGSTLRRLLERRPAGCAADPESLVDRRTFAIDDSIFVAVPQRRRSPGPACTVRPRRTRTTRHLLRSGTGDKLLIGGHYYSDESPVPTLLFALLLSDSAMAHGAAGGIPAGAILLRDGLAVVRRVVRRRCLGGVSLRPGRAVADGHAVDTDRQLRPGHAGAGLFPERQRSHRPARGGDALDGRPGEARRAGIAETEMGTVGGDRQPGGIRVCRFDLGAGPPMLALHAGSWWPGRTRCVTEVGVVPAVRAAVAGDSSPGVTYVIGGTLASRWARSKSSSGGRDPPSTTATSRGPGSTATSFDFVNVTRLSLLVGLRGFIRSQLAAVSPAIFAGSASCCWNRRTREMPEVLVRRPAGAGGPGSSIRIAVEQLCRIVLLHPLVLAAAGSRILRPRRRSAPLSDVANRSAHPVRASFGLHSTVDPAWWLGPWIVPDLIPGYWCNPQRFGNCGAGWLYAATWAHLRQSTLELEARRAYRASSSRSKWPWASEKGRPPSAGSIPARPASHS